jgi:hypothetical protein
MDFGPVKLDRPIEVVREDREMAGSIREKVDTGQHENQFLRGGHDHRQTGFDPDECEIWMKMAPRYPRKSLASDSRRFIPGS